MRLNELIALKIRTQGELLKSINYDDPKLGE